MARLQSGNDGLQYAALRPNLSGSKAAIKQAGATALWPLDEPAATTSLRDVIKGIEIAIASGTLTPGRQALGGNDFGSAISITPASVPFVQTNGANVANLGRNDGTLPMSIAMLIRPNVTRSGSNQRYHMISSGAWNFRLQWEQGIAKTYLDFAFQADGSHILRRASKTVDLANDTNYHVVVTYDGSRTAAGVKFYVNGALTTGDTVVTDTFGTSLAAVPQAFALFRSIIENGAYFGGDIDEIAYFERELSAADVTTLYNAAAPSKPFVDVPTARRPNLLIGNDIEGDVDGLIALGIAIWAHKQGYCNLVHHAAISTLDKEAPLLRAILDYYGMQSCVVSAPRTETVKSASPTWATDLYTSLVPGGTQTDRDYIGTTVGMRRDLARLPDHSCVLAWAGSPTALAALMKSQPDEYANMTGTAMIQRKCARVVLMGGEYPSGVETNFATGIAAAQYVMGNMPASVEMVLSPHAAGADVSSGSGSPAGSPIRRGIDGFGTANPGQVVGGNRVGSYDALAILIAIFGRWGNRFSLSTGRGQVSVNGATGSTSWAASQSYNHAFMGNAASGSSIATDINAILAALG